MKKVYFTKEEKAKSFASKAGKPVHSHKNNRGQLVYTVIVGSTPRSNNTNEKPSHLGEEYNRSEWADYCWAADDF